MKGRCRAQPRRRSLGAAASPQRDRNRRGAAGGSGKESCHAVARVPAVGHAASIRDRLRRANGAIQASSLQWLPGAPAANLSRLTPRQSASSHNLYAPNTILNAALTPSPGHGSASALRITDRDLSHPACKLVVKPFDAGGTQCRLVTILLTAQLASSIPSGSWLKPTLIGQHVWRDESRSSNACSHAYGRSVKSRAVTRRATTAPATILAANLAETASRPRRGPDIAHAMGPRAHP